MKEAIIAPAKLDGKGRAFRATCLGLIQADGLWDAGGTGHVRPVWAMFGGSEQELRPFMANLVTGKRAAFKDSDHFEFLRSVGFKVTYQKELEGSVATIFLPELFELDPGMVDPNGVNFIVMPSLEWSQAQKIDAAPILKHVRKFDDKDLPKDLNVEALVPLAFLFASYLDRRTRFPLYADGRFYMQLLLACLQTGLASWSDGYRDQFGINTMLRFKAEYDAPLVKPIAFHASHDEIGEILDKQVTLFIDTTANKPVKRKLT